MLVEGAGDYLILLLLSELHKVHRIARDTHRQLRIKLGMLLCIEERFSIKHIDVEMLAVLHNVAVKKGNEVADGVLLGFS